MRTFRLKNRERYQHYKTRNAPWVKLYAQVWVDEDFFGLAERLKLRLISLYSIVSRCKDWLIPENPAWLAACTGLDFKASDFAGLLAAGFLIEGHASEQNASTMLASHKQDATALEESREEREERSSSLRSEDSAAPESGAAEVAAPPESPSAQEWPDEERWLLDFLDNGQKAFNGVHLPNLRLYEFWDDLSVRVNGLSKPFVEREFAGMRIWLRDNPARGPTPKGVRRFVSNWMQRAAEQERRKRA